MTDIGKEISAVAKKHIENGKSLKFTIEDSLAFICFFRSKRSTRS
jgi:hypothetical protein